MRQEAPSRSLAVSFIKLAPLLDRSWTDLFLASGVDGRVAIWST